MEAFDLLLPWGERVQTHLSAFEGSPVRHWGSVVSKLKLREGSIVALSRVCPEGAAADAASKPCVDLAVRKLAQGQGATALAAATAVLCPCGGHSIGDIAGWPLAAVAPEVMAAAVGRVRSIRDEAWASKADAAAAGGKRPADGDAESPAATRARLDQQLAAGSSMADAAATDDSRLTTAVKHPAAGDTVPAVAAATAADSCLASGGGKSAAEESAESPPAAAAGDDAADAAGDSCAAPAADGAAAGAARQLAFPAAEGIAGADAAADAAADATWDAAEGSGDAVAGSCSTAAPEDTAAEMPADAAADAAAELFSAAAEVDTRADVPAEPEIEEPAADAVAGVAVEPETLVAEGTAQSEQPFSRASPQPPAVGERAADRHGLAAAPAQPASLEPPPAPPQPLADEATSSSSSGSGATATAAAPGGGARLPTAGTPAQKRKRQPSPGIRNSVDEHAARAVHPLADGPVTVALPVQDTKKRLQLPHRLLR